jgi:hypothetical protein
MPTNYTMKINTGQVFFVLNKQNWSVVVCVCVCVCVWERERERVCVCVFVFLCIIKVVTRKQKRKKRKEKRRGVSQSVEGIKAVVLGGGGEGETGQGRSGWVVGPHPPSPPLHAKRSVCCLWFLMKTKEQPWPHTPPPSFALLLFCFPKQEQHLSQRGFDLVKWGFCVGWVKSKQKKGKVVLIARQIVFEMVVEFFWYSNLLEQQQPASSKLLWKKERKKERIAFKFLVGHGWWWWWWW